MISRQRTLSRETLLWDEQPVQTAEKDSVCERSRSDSTSAAIDTVSRSNIRAGMAVLSRDAEYVGRVYEVRDVDLEIDRPLQRNVYVPLTDILAVVDEHLVLTVTQDEAYGRAWKRASLLSI